LEYESAVASWCFICFPFLCSSFPHGTFSKLFLILSAYVLDTFYWNDKEKKGLGSEHDLDSSDQFLLVVLATEPNVQHVG
jgi:hypothetical protein